ncbi:MAG: glutathione S-transferase family protein [Steroidobacteraceae bacterium]
MLRVYGDIFSGNCFKVKLVLLQLATPHEWIDTDLLRGDTHTAEFLAMNPNARVPLLDLGNGQFLPESNAILHYLAEGSHLLPRDRLQRARVLQWMFFEQYSHEPFVAVARFILRYLGRPAKEEERLQRCFAPGYRALDVMEKHLAQCNFLVAERYSIADIALYAYTHVAHEGGFDLGNYPATRAWLARVRGQPNYRAMDDANAP